MKKILLLLIFVACFSQAQSQNYVSFPDTNSIWVNTHYSVVWTFGIPVPSVVLSGVRNYCATGADTVINTLSYSKIEICGGAYKGAIRDDSGTVFFVPKDSLTEFLLYSFIAKPGDTLKNVYYEIWFGTAYLQDYIIEPNAVDSMQVNGSYRRMIKFQGGSEWIEGIGNTQGLFLENWGNVSNYFVKLECMSQDDTTLYPTFSPGACSLTTGIIKKESSDSPVLIYPNSSNGRFTCTLKGNLKNFNASITNSLGQTIFPSIQKKDNGFEVNLENYPDGIYQISIGLENGIFQSKLIKKSF